MRPVRRPVLVVPSLNRPVGDRRMRVHVVENAEEVQEPKTDADAPKAKEKSGSTEVSAGAFRFRLELSDFC